MLSKGCSTLIFLSLILFPAQNSYIGRYLSKINVIMHMHMLVQGQLTTKRVWSDSISGVTYNYDVAREVVKQKTE